MESIFSKIIRGEIPCYKIAEDNEHLAFLDIMPLKKGHVLVIPKKQTDYIFDINPNELACLHKFAQKVAIAIKKSIKCKKIGMAVVGLEVPHAHIHLIPIEEIGDIDFSKPKLIVSSEELKNIAENISANFLGN
ncbi:MAG: HIT family protein [Bacteroidia bacterium]|nr:HIT family protein [Bacteroidia bacterium]